MSDFTMTILDINYCLMQAHSLSERRLIKKSRAYLDMVIFQRPKEIRHLSHASELLLRNAAHNVNESGITPRNLRYLETAMRYIERIEATRPGTATAHPLREKLDGFFDKHNLVVIDAAFVARTPIDENHLPKFISDPARPAAAIQDRARVNRQNIKARL